MANSGIQIKNTAQSVARAASYEKAKTAWLH